MTLSQRLRPIALVVAAAAAVLWACDLTLLQPLTEPAKPWSNAVAENNTYWARDLRFAAIVALVGVLVIAVGGSRRRSAIVVAIGLGWIALDVVLDRYDVAGTAALVWVGAVAVVVVVGAALLLRLGARATEPNPWVLTVVGCVAAALTPFAALIESPTDTEPALNPMVTLVAATLVAVALLAATEVNPSLSPLRTGVVATVLVGCVGGIIVLRLAVPGSGTRYAIAMAIGAVLLSTVVLMRRHVVRPLVALGVGLATTVAYVVLATFAFFSIYVVPIAALFTALAGNPPVHGADTDAIFTIPAVALGIAWAFAVRFLERAGTGVAPRRLPVKSHALWQ